MVTTNGTGTRFDATKHLTTLKGKQYLEVKYRLLWLRTEHPEAIINTELVKLEETRAIFRATVEIPGAGKATGYGSETAADFGDFLEKAETKSVGRACAALGYGTAFAVDFDEGEHVVDAPVEHPQQAQPPARSQHPPRLPWPTGTATARRMSPWPHRPRSRQPTPSATARA